MLGNLQAQPVDPVLGIAAAYQSDPNSHKIDLSVGIYKDDTGICPIFGAIKEAERRLLETETSKRYLGLQGDPTYITQTTNLVLGDLQEERQDLIGAIASPGGSGALMLLGSLIHEASPNATIWIPDVTWANHKALLGRGGAQIASYRYFSKDTLSVEFEQMMDTLEQCAPGDVVLLHGCCHNPTGADLTQPQWDSVTTKMKERNLIPLLDIAYQGFGESIEADAYGVRRCVRECSEVLVAVSASKSFGVYTERAGLAMAVCESASDAGLVVSNLKSIARKTYSFSPSHGSSLVGAVLAADDLRMSWKSELGDICNRLNGLRSQLAECLNSLQQQRDFSYLMDNSGMFSLLGITQPQAERLREEFAIYVLNSGRINIAGLAADTVEPAAQAISKVIA